MILHLITPEYPPRSGGVSHYVRLLAQALGDAGAEVHVWCPPAQAPAPAAAGVHVHHELGGMSAGNLKSVGKVLNRFSKPRRLIVQWVPHGYRYRSMNVGLCLWLWSRAALRGDCVEIMIHEAFLEFKKGNWRQNAAALVHRIMMTILMQSTRQVWMSFPGIEPLCRPCALGRSISFGWLPIPSTVPVTATPSGVQEVRRRYTLDGQLLVGHFGTYGALIASMLEARVPSLLQRCQKAALLLIGPGGHEFHRRLVANYPELSGRVHSTGHLDYSLLSCHVGACDVMIQPYPDGLTTRRTTIMAPLSHGLPIVTTSGFHTEDFWTASGALAIAPEKDTAAFIDMAHALLTDEAERGRLGSAAAALYKQRFDVREVASTLLTSPTTSELIPIAVERR